MDTSMDVSSDRANVNTSNCNSNDVNEQRRRQQLKEASQRCRKRQKQEAMQYTSQINKLRQEINILKGRLSGSNLSPVSRQVKELVQERFLLQQRVDFVRSKLEDHKQWMQEIRNLILAAPLMDYIIATSSDGNTDKFVADSIQTSTDQTNSQENDASLLPPRPLPPLSLRERIDAWREQCQHGQKYSDAVVDRQLNAYLTLFNVNVHHLLHELTNSHCQFGVRFQSRGWSFAGNALDQLVTFRAERVLPSNHAQHVAQEMWHSLIRDDILRTFVPIVHDSVSVREHSTYSLTRRCIQLTPYAPINVLVTVESMRQTRSLPVEEWYVAIGSSQDPTLNALAMARGGIPDNGLIETSPAKSSVLSPSSPQSTTDRGHTNRKNNTVNDFVIAASCCQDNHDVHVKLVGSIKQNGTVQDNVHVQLLQYLVSILPVFEEVCLSPQMN